MLRWCIYCWRFLGERAPLDDFTATHGCCRSCAVTVEIAEHSVVDRARRLAAFHRELVAFSQSGEEDDGDLRAMLDRGRDVGILPTELLLGMIQPALYEIGRLWQAKLAHEASEAKLTRFCTRVLAALREEQRIRPAVANGRTLVLARAPGNEHELGMQIAAFVLREQGYDVRVVPFTPAASSLVALATAVEAHLIGISLSAPVQLTYAEELLGAIEQGRRHVEVVVGGPGVASMAKLRRWDGTTVLAGELRPGEPRSEDVDALD